MSLKSRIEVFNRGENQLNREIEQLERKFLTILERGLNDNELRKFGEDNGTEGCDGLKEKILEPILDSEIGGKICNDFKRFGFGIEEKKKYGKSEGFTELGTYVDMQQASLSQLISDNRELAEKFENMDDEVECNEVENEVNKANASDGDEEEQEEEGIGKSGACELCKEIELLEAMLERGNFGLLDLQMMMEEVEALKGPEKMMSEMEVKMGELESGLWELKSAIVELKGKKIRELKCWLAKEEEKEFECGEHEEELNAGKLNWGSVGAVVVAAAAIAALVFMGQTRVNVAAEKKKKMHKTG